MHPQFQILGITIHVFGLSLALALALFLWMSHRLAVRGQVSEFYAKNVWFALLGGLVCSRIAFFIGEWRDYKFLFSEGSWMQTFFMSDYNLSLAGALFGFLAVFWWKSRTVRGRERSVILDVFVISFLFAATVGYVGALLGGQIYGTPAAMESAWKISYTHPLTPVPGEQPRFPLAIVYSLASFALFCVLYIAHSVKKIPGVFGYVGMILFGVLLLVGEFFNGSMDIFNSSFLRLNLNQMAGIGGIVLGVKYLYLLAKRT